MCFFPLKFLKAIIFVGSMCAISISIGLLALTIYMQVQKQQVINAASEGAVMGSLITLYASSIIFLLLGVAGLLGSMKEASKKSDNSGGCLFGFFFIGIMIFFLVFLVATIFFFVGPEAIFGNDCTQGQKTALISSLYETSTEAYNKFCKAQCKCKITNTSSYLYQSVSTYGGVISDTGVQRFGECDNATSSKTDIQIIATLQNLLGCGGWCPLDKEQPPFHTFTYRFRNINDCYDANCLGSLENCFTAFENFMTGAGRIVGIGCLVAVIVCFINLFAVCCICFHPSRKQKRDSNFYSQMIETN